MFSMAQFDQINVSKSSVNNILIQLQFDEYWGIVSKIRNEFIFVF